MSALMEDAVNALSPGALAAYRRNDFADIAFADDTLLLGTSTEYLSEFAEAVAQSGRAYGLELHVDKFQLLQINTQRRVRIAGNPVTAETKIAYLGTTLCEDGRMATELSRRIGLAASDFRTIQQVWRHSSLPLSWRLRVFSSLIMSKLMYSLPAGCFTKAELRRLDGFQARCLRRILRIPHSFVSRISNVSVLQKAGCEAASLQLRRKQLQLLGRVVRHPQGTCMRDVTFVPGSLRPATDRYVRRVGAPRKEWVRDVVPEAIRLTGSLSNLQAAATNAGYWKRIVRQAVI